MATSAHGLFRASGKSSRPVAIIDGSTGEIVRAEQLPREEGDFYPTPPEPTLALAHYERDALSRHSLIWEPACGDGGMAQDLRNTGISVVESDLIDRGAGAIIRDFFDFGFDDRLSNAVVTNPPYHAINQRDGKGRWLRHAMETLRLDYMALLLNWTWPGAGGLAALWATYPPARAYLMRWKIDFTGQGSPPMLNGWFVWDHDHSGPTELRMMDRVNPQQESMFAEAPHG